MGLAVLILDNSLMATFLASFQLTDQQNHERGTVTDVIETYIAEQIYSKRSPIVNILLFLCMS